MKPLPNRKSSGVSSVGQERTRATDEALEDVGDSLREQHRLGAVPSEVGDAIELSDLADGVQRSANDVRARDSR